MGFCAAPVTDEGGELAIAAGLAIRLDLRKERLGSSPVLPGAVGVGLERLNDGRVKRRQLARYCGSDIRWLLRLLFLAKPSPYRVARQSCALRHLVPRQFVA